MHRIKALPVAKVLGAVSLLMSLWLVFQLYQAGHHGVALVALILLTLTGVVFTSSRAYAWRYLYPGVAAVLIFIAIPALYTMQIGFTNYSSTNLLSFNHATQYLLNQTYAPNGEPLQLAVFHQGAQRYQLQLSDDDGQRWHSQPITLSDTARQNLRLQRSSSELGGSRLSQREVVAQLAALRQLVFYLGETSTPYRLAALSSVKPAAPLYLQQGDGSLFNQQNGERLLPDFNSGFYRTTSGTAIAPGFQVNIGWQNFQNLFSHSQLQAPLLSVFIWTVLFAGLTVLFVFSLGFVLANVLSWESLQGRGLYRLLLFLPYAVPAFISILIFRGLFNESFGEINTILAGLFGIQPNWFSNPWLAKIMLLVVNTWLGYPYMMLLSQGLMKSIPQDLYEAAAISGASAWTKLTRITLPLVLKPITPMLVATFAFNFNNFVLISLLTDGRPDFLNSSAPAGTTDILVSYTYRIAFQDSGQNFGLAAAISTLIFIVIALLSLLNLRLSRANAAGTA
ncbi:maltose ABC transporter permease MalF [Neisseriaceae bacterium TC5R-5]|nr:maltose ABC transporter permease MalF [Neisseriaceae bacterium TC5R-5]